MNQLIKFSGGIINSDPNSAAGAIVERDGNADIFGNVLRGSGGVNNGGSWWLSSFGTITTTISLTNASAAVQKVTAAAAYNITLPPAATSTGQVFIFIRTDSSGFVPTIKGNAAELINGSNTYAALTTQYSRVKIWCDGTQWYVLSA